MTMVSIAIDGPAGAGKSTIAKKLAKELGFLYIDTGAMYRALTYKALQLNVDLHNGEQLNQILLHHPIKLVIDKQDDKVFIGDEDITNKIRTPEVTNMVSLVAIHQEVRTTMVKIQRSYTLNQNVVMDGRDIGTNVLPNAELKIFLTASIKERARRRYQELLQKGYESSLEEIMNEIENRDKKDQERAVSPLKKAHDAITIDSSDMSIDEVINRIMSLFNQSRN